MKYLVALLLWINIAYAQPIEFVVSASPGGPLDTSTRKILEKIKAVSDMNIFVMNRPGAGHTIAYNYILNATNPLMILATDEVISTHDVITHIDDTYTIGHFDIYVFASSKSNIESLSNIKNREVKFGAPGTGASSSYTTMNNLCNTLNCLKVPYKSGAEGMLGLMKGEIDLYALPAYGTSHYLQNDKIKLVHTIKNKEKNWLKLFTKNISSKDKETIRNILKAQDIKFYNDMGFEK